MVNVQCDATRAQDEYLPFGDPEFVKNPYPWFERLRKESPLHRLPNGTYVVSRYKDIVQYGRLPELTILEPDSAPPNAFTTHFGETLLSREGPAHTQMRGLIMQWFTPTAVRQYCTAIEDAVNKALDDYKEGEIIDGHYRLGMIPTHAFMCEALQVPADDPEPAITAMLDVMRGISAVATKEDDELSEKAFTYLRARALELLEWKKANPGDGLADALIVAARNGTLTEEEMIQNFSLLWGSGAHNPSYLIGSALEHFARNPDLWDMYRQQPDKRRAIMNEIIRLYPAELSFIRNTTEPVEILGETIPKDTPVRFLLNSANRDPEIFPNPDEVDLNRPASARHLTFGIGPHACAGTMIARAEADAVFDTLAARVKRIELAAESTFDATDRSRAFLTQSLRLYFA